MTTPTPESVKALADGLIPLEVEWVTGWQGPPGAAYNIIGEDLQSVGILDGDWNLTPLGILVRAHIGASHD